MAYSALLANGKQRRYFKNLKQECWVEEQRRRTGSPRHSFRSQMLHLAPAQTVGERGHPLLGRRGRAGLGGRARQAATLPHTLQRMGFDVADLLVGALVARVTGCQIRLSSNTCGVVVDDSGSVSPLRFCVWKDRAGRTGKIRRSRGNSNPRPWYSNGAIIAIIL